MSPGARRSRRRPPSARSEKEREAARPLDHGRDAQQRGDERCDAAAERVARDDNRAERWPPGVFLRMWTCGQACGRASATPRCENTGRGGFSDDRYAITTYAITTYAITIYGRGGFSDDRYAYTRTVDAASAMPMGRLPKNATAPLPRRCSRIGVRRRHAPKSRCGAASLDDGLVALQPVAQRWLHSYGLYIITANIVMAYIAMACIAMAERRSGSPAARRTPARSSRARS